MRKKPSNRDDWHMNTALKQAARAAMLNEVPIGAVIVDKNNTIIARAYNQTIRRASPFAHAEVLAIQKAAKKLGDWRLNGCTIYVTVEPCALCMHTIIISRISRLVYGASSPLFGFSLDKYCNFDVYKTSLIIQAGIKKGEAEQHMKLFFRKKRSTLRDKKIK